MTKISEHKSFQKAAYWFLLLTIALVYWIFSRQYTGPAYLSDEIGYLTKAAAFAGYPIDMATSWHGGYSLLIAPVFSILSDPNTIWRGIIMLNAVMFASSFGILFFLLKFLYPDTNHWTILATLAVTALYPTWITMSGYAFSTPGLVLFYILSLVLLIKSSINNYYWILYSIVVGFLYWIHPSGLIVAIASVFVSIILHIYTNQFFRLIIHTLIVVTLIATYNLVVHPWLNHIMTPEQYVSNAHYPSFSRIIDLIMTPELWSKLFLITLGHFSYVFIATFGLAGYAVVYWHDRIKCIKILPNKQHNNIFGAVAISILSVLGAIIMGSILFSLSDPLRIDHWIYGRYSETFLFPILAMGMMAVWRYSSALTITFFLLITGFIISFFSNQINTVRENNLVNITAFWPQAILPQEQYISWFIAGALGVLTVYLFGKKYFAVIVLPVFFISIFNQASWHSRILADYSNPTSLVKFIRENFSSETCIGFNPSGSQTARPERHQLYSYYFYDYHYKRMPPEKWINTCDGPYLSYSVEGLLDYDKVNIIARSYANPLFLVVKPSALSAIDFSFLDKNEYYIDSTRKSICVVAGCFEMNHKELATFSRVGHVAEGGLESTGVRGYLFFGPYRSLDAGSYYIELDLEAHNISKEILSVVSDKGRKNHLDVQISDYLQTGHNILRIPFSLNEGVFDLELRFHISVDSVLSIRSYSIKYNDGDVEILELCESPTCLQWAVNSSRKIFTEVGHRTEKFFETNARRGYLLYGPYRPMLAGKYRFKLYGVVLKKAGVRVEVVANSGRTLFSLFEAPEPLREDGLILDNDVILDSDVADLEVRVFVEAESELRVNGYELKPIQFPVHAR